jgi:hypothetical protein
MLKRIALLISVILGICVLFYLADRFNSSVLWVMGFLAVGTLMRYGNLILANGNSNRVLSYFKRRPTIRKEMIDNVLASRQAKSELRTEEAVALLTICLSQESTDVVHLRASELQISIFNDEFFRYMLQVLPDLRAIGLDREFQLRFVGLGENLAQKHQLSEWVNEFQQQREQIFKRHKESIPIIRAPR